MESIGSCLYAEHLKLANRSHMADFAGYLMPLWYDGISVEHCAVRENCGLFDCTHMGVLEVSGGDAKEFLDILTTNDVSRLTSGTAQYSYILDFAANILDDIIIYQRAANKYMVVVNAANEPKIKSYIKDVLQKTDLSPNVRDMKDVTSGIDCKVDIALQGPKSEQALELLASNNEIKEQIRSLKSFNLIEIELAGASCIIARTGYTGSKGGFEIFVHPDKAANIWSLLLEKASGQGLLPCGLGARDSLRIEAGLPLYGHELAGEFNIGPFEAGYGWAVKLTKENFVGKAAIAKKADSYDMQVIRVKLAGEKGVRPAREKDAILNKEGVCVGEVLSSAKVSDNQYALCYVKRNSLTKGDPLRLYYLARNKAQQKKGRKIAVKIAERVYGDIAGEVVSRYKKFG